jgi:hypothetical protein
MFRIVLGSFVYSLELFLGFTFNLDQIGLFCAQSYQSAPDLVSSWITAWAGHFDIDRRPRQNAQVHHPSPVRTS